LGERAGERWAVKMVEGCWCGLRVKKQPPDVTFALKLRRDSRQATRRFMGGSA